MRGEGEGSAQMANENSYLGEVLEQQQRVDQELKARKRSMPMPSNMAAAPAQAVQMAGPAEGRGQQVFRAQAANLQQAAFTLEGRAIDYKITGIGPWKTVVVPPNVYVVHTRRGIEKPLHM